ncbi:MAG: hypothetical protein JSR39_01810 [Verrucomicrobia bacterium]|nr:hypothetical protein [Verrucomicrobiota bacterium]
MAASTSLPASSHRCSLGWQKSILKSDASSLIYSLPSGKPNTKIPLTSGGEDLRPRVDQAPQAGPNCYYYALNMLRKRIGPNPPKEYEQARRIEKCISSYRKEITQLELDFSKNFSLFQIILDSYRLGPDLHSIQQKLPEILAQIELMNRKFLLERNDSLLKISSRAATILKGFCGQNEWTNLHEYIQYIKVSKYRAVHDKFFQALGVDPKERYDRNIKDFTNAFLDSKKIHLSESDRHDLIIEYSNMFLSWEEAVRQTPGYLGVYFHLAAADAYGFKQADWTPLEPISSLFEDLKKHGPLYVGGFFGSQYYSKPPTIRQTIEGRSVYGWNSEDRLSEDKFQTELGDFVISGHAIVIIGAAEGGSKGGFVYFVDPLDGSSVSDPSQQKIYAITYENLINNVSTLDGKKFPRSSINPSFRYALYYPK